MEGDEGDIEEAWRYFIWMSALEWRFLPRMGALEDQDELLLNNIFAIRNAITRMKNK
jgi:hypothetical protein